MAQEQNPIYQPDRRLNSEGGELPSDYGFLRIVGERVVEPDRRITSPIIYAGSAMDNVVGVVGSAGILKTLLYGDIDVTLRGGKPQEASSAIPQEIGDIAEHEREGLRVLEETYNSYPPGRSSWEKAEVGRRMRDLKDEIIPKADRLVIDTDRGKSTVIVDDYQAADNLTLRTVFGDADFTVKNPGKLRQATIFANELNFTIEELGYGNMDADFFTKNAVINVQNSHTKVEIKNKRGEPAIEPEVTGEEPSEPTNIFSINYARGAIKINYLPEETEQPTA
jgi:hypothetical protein